ncbi:hypothetical protein K449DRAFT_429789 [Hypoxylon sp. EC38]|nr:hypothetical protein K449DRAFT_429789 [Hypoxylon sp. EC38]
MSSDISKPDRPDAGQYLVVCLVAIDGQPVRIPLSFATGLCRPFWVQMRGNQFFEDMAASYGMDRLLGLGVDVEWHKDSDHRLVTYKLENMLDHI